MPPTTDVIVSGPHPAKGANPPSRPDRARASDFSAAPVGQWLATLAVSSVAIPAAWFLADASLPIVLLVVSLLAVGLAVFSGRTEAAPLVFGMIPATLLANSGLVPAATYFVPAAILGLSLVLWAIRWSVRERRLPPLPPRAFVASAVLYVAAAAVATVFSIRPATSVPYLGAIATVLLVSLWLGPWLISRSDLAANALAFIAFAGVAATLIGLVLSVTGPVLWFDRWLGAYLVQELTLNSDPTGVIVLRSAGPFLAPGGQALVLAPAILAALALRRRLAGRRRILASLAVLIILVGLLATFARVGWAAVIVGSALLAMAPIRSRRVDVAPALICVVTAAAFVGLWVDAVGADYRPDLTEIRNRAALPHTSPGGAVVPVPEIPTPDTSGVVQEEGLVPRVTRGGSELSGRMELWSASLLAIANSPWVGYGPGTNGPAIEPYLQGEGRRLVGLTSHNTWLRTWVEDGVVGFIGFVGVALTAVFLALKRVVARGRARSLDLGLLAMFVGLAVSQTFETLLLGGVTLPSFAWSLVAGLLAIASTSEPSHSISEVDA